MTQANNTIHLWLLDDEENSTTVLCTECSNNKYEQLFIRQQWQSKDSNKTMRCDGCGKNYVLEYRRS